MIFADIEAIFLAARAELQTIRDRRRPREAELAKFLARRDRDMWAALAPVRVAWLTWITTSEPRPGEASALLEVWDDIEAAAGPLAEEVRRQISMVHGRQLRPEDALRVWSALERRL